MPFNETITWYTPEERMPNDGENVQILPGAMIEKVVFRADLEAFESLEGFAAWDICNIKLWAYMPKGETNKLYVWKRWYNGSYFPGLAFAIAENEEEAKRAIIDGSFFFETEKIEWGEYKVYELDKPIGFSQGGGD